MKYLLNMCESLSLMSSTSEKLVKLELLYDFAISFLGLYPEVLKSIYNRNTYTHIYHDSIHNNQDIELA